MLSRTGVKVGPRRRDGKGFGNFNGFEMNFPRFRPVLLPEFGEDRFFDDNVQIAEGFLHGLKLLEGVAGIVAGFEIEGVNQFQCFGVAPGAEVVAEGGEKFRNGLSVFRGVAEAHAIKNVVHRRRISFPQDFFLLLYFLFRFFQEKRFVHAEGNPAEMRSL